MKCSYGCNSEGIFYSPRSKKWRCSKITSCCPVLRDNARKLGTGKQHSDETKLKLSVHAKKNKYGGYRKGSGVGKCGWFKGIWCDSSWELAFVIWCLEHNKPIRRNDIKYPYTYNDKKTYYIPDFIVDGKIVEIKGYMTEKVRIKLSACKEDIELIGKKEIIPYIEYVKNKYGKDYIKLYGE